MRNLEFTENEKIEFAYDVFAGILAIIATLVVTLQFNKNITASQLIYLRIADKIIYGIFLVEFLIRLYFSKNKIRYVKNNLFDFVAVIPFDFFTVSPYGSVFKLLKVLAYILRLIDNLKELLYTNGFIYSLGGTTIITIIGSFGMYIFEKDSSQTINSYGDALWWSFVTVTTVGYGDISPSTTIGRTIACVLMLSGIGFLSMLTSTVSTYFLSKTEKNKKKSIEENKEGGEEVLLDLSSLNEEQRKQLMKYYEFIKNS